MEGDALLLRLRLGFLFGLRLFLLFPAVLGELRSHFFLTLRELPSLQSLQLIMEPHGRSAEIIFVDLLAGSIGEVQPDGDIRIDSAAVDQRQCQHDLPRFVRATFILASGLQI